MKITITDDAGALEGRVRTGDGGERFAFVRIGALDLSIDGYDEAAAERCQAIAAEFHRIALELLRPAPVGEAERIEGIRNAIRAARLPPELGERLIAENVELVDAQRRVFQELAAAGVRPDRPPYAIACNGGLEAPRELSSDEAVDAAGAALSDRARALDARQAPAGEGPKS